MTLTWKNSKENTKETEPQKNAAWNNKNNLKPTHSTWNLNEPESNFWTRPKIWKTLTRKWFIKKSQPNSKHLTSEKTNKIFFLNSPTMKLFTKLPWWKKRPNLKNFPNFKLRILLSCLRPTLSSFKARWTDWDCLLTVKLRKSKTHTKKTESLKTVSLKKSNGTKSKTSTWKKDFKKLNLNTKRKMKQWK